MSRELAHWGQQAVLLRLLDISPPWRIYHQRTETSDRRRGLDLAMWDDDHSTYGGRGTERRVAEGGLCKGFTGAVAHKALPPYLTWFCALSAAESAYAP